MQKVLKMNYNEIGFKCGLEIHQQLDTSKLFCNCSSEIRSGKPDKMFRRRLRAAAGESGRVDAAAEHEQKKGKYFDYHYYNFPSFLLIKAQAAPATRHRQRPPNRQHSNLHRRSPEPAACENLQRDGEPANRTARGRRTAAA